MNTEKIDKEPLHRLFLDISLIISAGEVIMATLAGQKSEKTSTFSGQENSPVNSEKILKDLGTLAHLLLYIGARRDAEAEIDPPDITDILMEECGFSSRITASKVQRTFVRRGFLERTNGDRLRFKFVKGAWAFLHRHRHFLIRSERIAKRLEALREQITGWEAEASRIEVEAHLLPKQTRALQKEKEKLLSRIEKFKIIHANIQTLQGQV